jgi:hypothetical protein
VTDRRLFGHLRWSVLIGSAINNVVPVAIAFPLAIVFCGPGQTWWSLLDAKVATFALLVQVVALLFGYAFRVSPIPRIIVFAKLPDLFIPLGIFLEIGNFNWRDYAFSVATVLACLPVFIKCVRPGVRAQPVLLAVCAALIVQGSLSPLLVGSQPHSLVLLTAYTWGLLVWRLVFSAGVVAVSRVNSGVKAPLSEADPGPVCISRVDFVLFVARGVVALITQLTFVIALGSGKPAIAWPVINSTPLLSVVASAILLREKPSRGELAAVVLICGLAVGRELIG